MLLVMYLLLFPFQLLPQEDGLNRMRMDPIVSRHSHAADKVPGQGYCGSRRAPHRRQTKQVLALLVETKIW